MRPPAPVSAIFVLLFAVFFHVRFTGFLGVIRRMMTVTTGSMRVMGGLFVLPALMMFSGLRMVSRRVSMMFCCFFMVFGCFLGHGTVLWWVRNERRDTPLGPKLLCDHRLVPPVRQTGCAYHRFLNLVAHAMGEASNAA